MSVEIPTDRPLNDEEREHLEVWGRVREIEAHDRRFPPEPDAFEESEDETPSGEGETSSEETDESEDDETPPYSEWTNRDLLAEVKARKLPVPEGRVTKEVLVSVLESNDAESEGGE